MPIFVAIVHIGATMIPDILSRAFNPIVKAAALNIVKLPWQGFPITPIPITILTVHGR